MDWERLSKRLRVQNWIILMALGSGSFFLMPPVFTFGVILGGLIIIANFNILQLTIRRSFSPSGVISSPKLSIMVKCYLRLTVLGIIIYMLVGSSLVDPVGLTVGLSIVVISITNIGIRAAWKISSGEAV